MSHNVAAIFDAVRAGYSHVYTLMGPVTFVEWAPRGAPVEEFTGRLELHNGMLAAYDSAGAYLCHFILLRPERAALYAAAARDTLSAEVVCEVVTGRSFQSLREATADRLERRGKVMGVDA